jgi:putative tryptophan/tyrosine transport system substrate-binding protein
VSSPSARSRATAAVSAAAIFALVFAWRPVHAGAYEIAIVQSLQNPVYDKTIEGFETTCGGQVTTYTLDKTTKTLTANDLADIKSRKPSAILAIGPSALLEIFSKKPPMPIVFTAITEKPANVSPAAGVLMNVPMDKQLETLLKLSPGVKSIGVVYNKSKTLYFVSDLQRAAKARNINVEAIDVATQEDAVKALSGLFNTADAIFLSPDTSVHSAQLEQLAGRLSLSKKKAVVGFRGSQLSNGFLFASEMDPIEMGKQAGDVTKQLLAGKKPTQPYEPVRKYKLILNTKVATQLDLVVPADVSAGAKIFGDE